LSHLSRILKCRMLLLEILGLGTDCRAEMLLRAARRAAALKFGK
jgi:hypothetical protein